MKIKTDIKFEESYIPQRCRKERIREAVKTIYTNVQEASYADAPVAFREQEHFRDGVVVDGVYPCGITKGENPVGGEMELEMWVDYRWYKKNLYRRVMAHDKSCGDIGAWSLIEFQKRYSSYSRYDKSMGEIAVSRAARKEIHSYLLLDGDVWIRCGEPVYIIATFGLGHNHASTNLMTDSYYKGYEKECFNSLQRDNAISECKQVALERGDTDSVHRIGEFWKIEVLIPEAVKAPAHNPIIEMGFNARAERLIRSSGSIMEAGLLVMSEALLVANNEQNHKLKKE